MLRRLAASVVAYAVLPLLLIVGLEALARTDAAYTPRRVPFDLFERPGGAPAYRLRPGFSGQVWGAPVTVDARGLRRPGEEALPADTAAADTARRLLLVGDSMMFGLGVSDGQAPAGHLARALPGVEVWGGAVVAYSIHDVAAWLDRYGDRHRPTVVVYGYCANDPLPSAEILRFGGNAALPWRARLEEGLVAHSALYLWLRAHAYPQRTYRQSLRQVEAMHEGPRWPPARAALGRIAAWTRARRIPLVVVLFPQHAQVMPGGSRRWQAAVRAAAEAEGARVLDLTPVLREGDFLPYDMFHLRSSGYRRVGDALAGALRPLLVSPTP